MKVALINDTGGRGHYGCDLVMNELRRGLFSNQLATAWVHPVGLDWRPISSELLGREAVQGVVVNGEGSIHHSAWHKRASFLAEFASFAKERLQVPSFLVNATITEIDDSVAGHLGAYEEIFVRDSGTQRELAGYGLSSVVVPDLTIGASLPIANARSGICVIDSVVKEVQVALIALAEREGWQHCSLHDRKENIGIEAFSQFLSSHRLVITGRYHAVTMCLATRTPFLALESNTPKISWLLDDVFGNRRRLLSPGDLNAIDTEAFEEWTAEESSAIEAFIGRTRHRQELMFREIGRRLSV